MDMESIRISVVIASVALFAVLIAESPAVAGVKDISYELLSGIGGGWLGGRLGGLAVYVIGRPFTQWEGESGPGNRSLPLFGIATHGGMIAGSIGGVYLASDREGSLLWTAVGSFVPVLISMVYVSIKGESISERLIWSHELFGYFGTMYRGFAGTLFSPLGALLAYELSRSNGSQQRNGQPSQNATSALHMTLLRVEF
jgi:hypothetical protein